MATTHTNRRSRLASDRYWHLSSAADTAIDAALRADHRRTWDPRGDYPSLASLRGEARKWCGHYVRSRHGLLQAAGVRVRRLYERSAGRLIWIVTMPNEPITAAVTIDRQSRTLRAR